MSEDHSPTTTTSGQQTGAGPAGAGADDSAAAVDPATSYKDAAFELDAIVSELESGKLGVDEVVEHVARAAALVTYCRNKVSAAQARVKDITDTAMAASGT